MVPAAKHWAEAPVEGRQRCRQSLAPLYRPVKPPMNRPSRTASSLRYITSKIYHGLTSHGHGLACLPIVVEVAHVTVASGHGTVGCLLVEGL